MTYTMDGYKEILKQIKKDFLKEYDWDYYKIGLYHGTDRFVLDLSDEKRKIYKEALIKYLDTICNMNIERQDNNGLDKIEANSLIILQRVKDSSKQFEYKALYTTSDLDGACSYANQARYFGELGSVVYGLRSFVKKKQLFVDKVFEKEEILEDLFGAIEKSVPEPVILKIMGKDKIMSMENGDDFNEKICIKSYCSGKDQMSFRMNEEVTLDAFEIINAAEEKELREKNMKRINEMFSKYQTSHLINDFGLTDSDFKKLKITGQIKPLIYTSIYK